MPDQSLDDPSLSEPVAELLREIQQTPKEYWPNLLQMIRLFRESVTVKPAPSDAWAKAMDEIKNPDPVEKVARQKALSDLLKSWEEEGDEQEQTETWEYLRQALDEDRLSNRPLFP
ncbi:hypothetical protein H6F74_28670 [Trichocoleus sp. FACHB-90]|nr:hypothetical protein [Trichocoleus sp. FACHB-90]